MHYHLRVRVLFIYAANKHGTRGPKKSTAELLEQKGVGWSSILPILNLRFSQYAWSCWTCWLHAASADSRVSFISRSYVKLPSIFIVCGPRINPLTPVFRMSCLWWATNFWEFSFVILPSHHAQGDCTIFPQP